MPVQLFKNNASSTLSGSLSQGGTTMVLSSGTGDRFPAPTGGDYFLLTLYEKDVSANEEMYEIVKVTARTADTLTIVRDFENIVGVAGGRAYPTVGGRTVYCELRWTAGATDALLQDGDIGVTVQAYDADLTDLANLNAATGKATPVDADLLPLADSAASFGFKKLSWGNLKATAKTYFDTLYATVGHNHSGVYQPYDANLPTWPAAVSATEVGYLDGVTSSVQTQLGGKQATLVSGTNIKTINGQSILGSGDVQVASSPVTNIMAQQLLGGF